MIRALCLLLALLPTSAHAFWGKSKEEALLLGPNIGASAQGAVLGLELSHATFQWNAFTWSGAWIDLTHNLGTDTTRIGAGLQGGVAIVGLDAGPFLQLDDRGPSLGMRARGLLTATVVTLYAGGGATHREDSGFTEAGVLFKLPL